MLQDIEDWLVTWDKWIVHIYLLAWSSILKCISSKEMIELLEFRFFFLLNEFQQHHFIVE